MNSWNCDLLNRVESQPIKNKRAWDSGSMRSYLEMLRIGIFSNTRSVLAPVIPEIIQAWPGQVGGVSHVLTVLVRS